MRPIWTGSISFGLLQVPVQLFSATRDLDLHFHLLDARDKKRVRYQRVNTATGEEVPWAEIVKGYEVKDGGMVVVDEDELKRAAPEQTQTIDLEAFVPRCDVDPIYFDRPYYVVPGKRAEKAYAVLRDALAKSGKIGIARVVIRTRQHLAAVLPEGDGLMLTLMRFAQEVVDPAAVGLDEVKRPKVSAAELGMAEQLLESMSQPWDPAAYRDEFRTKLRELLERRAKRGEIPPEPRRREAPAAPVNDLAALLQQSLQEGRRRPARRPARARHRPVKRATRRRAR